MKKLVNLLMAAVFVVPVTFATLTYAQDAGKADKKATAAEKAEKKEAKKKAAASKKAAKKDKKAAKS